MKRLIEEVDGVASANVDLNTGKALVTLKPGANLDEAKLRDNVDRDFKVESCSKVVN